MQKHLSPAAFVDLLDGTTSEAAVSHLDVCAACRDQLAALRALHTEVDRTEVPEPSPLFWDHLSARVRDAVAAESTPTSWWGGGWWRAVAVAGTMVLVLLLVAPRMWQRPPAAASGATDQAMVSQEPSSAGSATVAPDDAAADDTLEFVSNLAGEVDWDAAVDAGLVEPGTADLALAQMDSNERVELQRLLQAALTKGGA